MTDIELVEMAAKAAGIKYDQESAKPHPKSDMWFGLWLLFDREPSEYDRRYWNPLADDGDALRLAVKLGIPLEFCHASGIVTATDPWSALAFDEPPAGDSYASARLAIVRAAAQIAREAS